MDLFEEVEENIYQLAQIGSDPAVRMSRLLYSSSWLAAQLFVKEKRLIFI